MQMRCAAIAFSQSALNSAQVLGSEAIPACAIALVEAQSQLMRWMFMGAATQSPVGFITGRSSGATTLSHPSALASSSRLAAAAQSVHSGVFRPFRFPGRRALAAPDLARTSARLVVGVPPIQGLLLGSP